MIFVQCMHSAITMVWRLMGIFEYRFEVLIMLR